ncbi:hypothetical protein NQ176_g9548 [Zarea fungicola]|uniref:Uncharacterized protein n=1 Tax=Zarea fungicola TaxID=93591 RepID=A0ACC1MMV5_9HYPO|nr:hypothetical protein NQ176_g9548 [Lecanicillium fungicola]
MDELPALKWHGSFTIFALDAANGNNLDGDKIILPQSALEQMLSASTSAALMGGHYTSPSSQLPNPLTFRVVNPANHNVVYAGIREFSAPEGTVLLSPYLLSALGLDPDHAVTDKTLAPALQNGSSQVQLEIHASTLPKATYARLRPLEAGYNPDDWRPLLERQLQRSFTSLTKNATIRVHGVRGEVFQLLVDKLSPDVDGVCVVDTDIEVDIEALDEEQARETLRRVINKDRQANGHGVAKDGSIDIWKPVSGEVALGNYVDYTLPSWNRSQPLQITLSDISDSDALDLFVTPKSNYQRAVPRSTEHVFSTLSLDAQLKTKTILISPTNVEVEKAENIQISVYAYPDPSAASSPHQVQYTLRAQIAAEDSRGSGEVNAGKSEEHGENEAQCSNCSQWVPKQSVVLHENFCRRNNVICSICKSVFRKDSEEWNAHWHCAHDTAHGDSQYARHKHDDIFHGNWEGDAINPAPEVVLSGLTAHELADGARTTECHLCDKIVKLRDMQTHLKHHELDKVGKAKPPICRNVNCGRTLFGVGSRGQVRQGPGADGQQGGDHA